MSTAPLMLVPIDWTGCAWDVIAFVTDFAKKLEHRVVILNCVRLPAGMDAHTVLHPDGLDIEVEEWLDADAREQLGPMLETLHDAGLDASIELRHGEPVPVILDAIEQLKPQHVVMGTRGRKGLRRMLEGSVAESVLRRATVPVTIIHSLAEGAHPGESAAQVQAFAEGDG